MYERQPSIYLYFYLSVYLSLFLYSRKTASQHYVSLRMCVSLWADIHLAPLPLEGILGISGAG